jgi:hypothetical protein
MMTDEDYIELLKRNDDPDRWETPLGFDYGRESQDAQNFVNELQEKLHREIKFESGSHIQDASFHSQILFGQDSLRFSSFGRFAAFSPDAELPEEDCQIIKGLLEKRGYVLVPTRLLETKYTGKNPGVTGIRTWWIRFFDWV